MNQGRAGLSRLRASPLRSTAALNDRTDRRRQLRLALEARCRVAIDADAHKPSQLLSQVQGCEGVHLCGVRAGHVVNT